MPRASRRLEATLSRWRGRSARNSNSVAKIIGYGSRRSRNGKQELENQRFFGTLGESEWEEELSTAAMRQS